MEYLLDTNACIVLINRTSERVRERFSKAVESGALTWVSSVSLYELWYGVGKSARAEANAQRLKVFLGGPVRVLEFGEEDARYAGEIRSALERAGRPIGAYDVLIAGQAPHHLGRVLRAEVGQVYELSDGERVRLGRVESVGRERVEFALLEEIAAYRPAVETTLLLAIVKFDAFEWALEKATELGVG